MADKKNITDENYLDNLLKAITGESEGDTSDKINEDELDFESDVKADGSEEDFLSDFEKEFFDEDESKMLDDMFGEVKNNEQKVDNISDNMMFQFDDNMLEGMDEGNVLDEGENVDETKQLVDEAVDIGDSSVEEDLQGLYGILGVDNLDGEESSDKGKKTKKKGLFGRNKKEKEPKKEKEHTREKMSERANHKKDDEELSNDVFNDSVGEMAAETATDIDPALEGFDVEALFNNSDAFGGEGSELDISGELAFNDSDSMNMGGGSGGFDFGLDDSGFAEAEESENDMLIRQMEDGELDDDELLADEEESKSKKGKKKKEKKEKKEKDKGNKKEKPAKKEKVKKPKKVKEPKEKKPKEPDEVIHVPIIALVFMLSFIVVAVIAAKMGGDYYFYQERIYDAVELYVDTDQTDVDAYEGRYSDAYSILSGMEMRNKEHQAFFEQVQTIMFMDRHYEAYKGYMLLENFDNGLDSLIKAVKMYDKYQNEARELGCFDDMTVILSWVNDKLNNVYGITESRARELYMISDDREYAFVVRQIAGEAEEKYLESKTEEELK